MSEYLMYLNPENDHPFGIKAAQKVMAKFPRMFHLANRTTLQIIAYFGAEYGTSYTASYLFIRHMCKHAILGLRFRDRAAAEFPVPGKLNTADKAWFDREMPAVEAKMEKEFYFDLNVDQGSLTGEENAMQLFVNDKRKRRAAEAKKRRENPEPTSPGPLEKMSRFFGGGSSSPRRDKPGSSASF